MKTYFFLGCCILLAACQMRRARLSVPTNKIARSVYNARNVVKEDLKQNYALRVEWLEVEWQNIFMRVFEVENQAQPYGYNPPSYLLCRSDTAALRAAGLYTDTNGVSLKYDFSMALGHYTQVYVVSKINPQSLTPIAPVVMLQGMAMPSSHWNYVQLNQRLIYGSVPIFHNLLEFGQNNTYLPVERINSTLQQVGIPHPSYTIQAIDYVADGDTMANFYFNRKTRWNFINPDPERTVLSDRVCWMAEMYVVAPLEDSLPEAAMLMIEFPYHIMPRKSTPIYYQKRTPIRLKTTGRVFVDEYNLGKYRVLGAAQKAVLIDTSGYAMNKPSPIVSNAPFGKALIDTFGRVVDTLVLRDKSVITIRGKRYLVAMQLRVQEYGWGNHWFRYFWPAERRNPYWEVNKFLGRYADEDFKSLPSHWKSYLQQMQHPNPQPYNTVLDIKYLESLSEVEYEYISTFYRYETLLIPMLD